MAYCEKILIAGFSGAGKSSLLKEVAAMAPANWTRCEDLDQLILKHRGKNHPDLASLIKEVGWEKFRLWERQELEGWLKVEEKGVLALGGGSLSPLVWELYRSSRKIRFCWLKAPFEVCWQRLLDSQEVRPLVQKGEQGLRKIFLEREALFSQISWQLENTEGDLTEMARRFWSEAEVSD